MTARLPMGLHVSVHVNESATVEGNVHSAADAFALVALSSEFGPKLGLFFRTAADMDRVLEAMRTARHELAALTNEDEPKADTANTIQVATHADAA